MRSLAPRCSLEPARLTARIEKDSVANTAAAMVTMTSALPRRALCSQPSRLIVRIVRLSVPDSEGSAHAAHHGAPAVVEILERQLQAHHVALPLHPEAELVFHAVAVVVGTVGDLALGVAPHVAAQHGAHLIGRPHVAHE